jgi:hypothetical protein
MPSLGHEEIVELFRLDPRLAIELLQHSGALTLPPFAALEVRPGELRELLPTERRVDVVVLLSDEGHPVYVLAVEVQSSRDDRKRMTWPYYLTALRADYACPVALLVYALSAEVGTWARQPIDTGHPGWVLTPIVLEVQDVPRVEEEWEARASPYRAILSALMHASEPGAERVARAAFWGAEGLEPEARDMWRELVSWAVSSNEVAKKALEAMMAIENFAEKSVWARQAAEKAREAGILTGLEAGRVAGLEAGRVAGALAEARRAVGRVLSRRGLPVSAEQQARLDGCEDLATLERWHDQAITAASATEALG